ncbi:MAG: shikimate dehydrogenase [Phormidesmis sp. RL_2_1]|nr:shikimate dehydrogenase [Phormidesmis sp. RL_2_1]
MIKGTTQLLGVIGYPVEHSFSPLMHNAAIAHLNAQQANADFVYLPFPIRPEWLKDAIAGFTAIGLRGFNITIPHKQAIMPLLDDISDIARAIGAVNTVWRSESENQVRWHGTNTDVTGFMAPLKALKRDWSNAPAIILGNGGAARAVVAACHQLGFPQIWVVGRSPDKLQQFKQSWANSPDIAEKLSVCLQHDLVPYANKAASPKASPKASLVVNATPLGMHPQVKHTPLDQAQMQAIMATDAIAYDLIYTPRPTQFLQQASTAGFATIDGLEMLIQQGAAALEIWLGQPAPVSVMRQTLLNHLGQSHENRGKLNTAVPGT